MSIATYQLWPMAALMPANVARTVFQPKFYWLKPFFQSHVIKPVFQLPQGGFIDGYRLCSPQLLHALQAAKKSFAKTVGVRFLGCQSSTKTCFYAQEKIEFERAKSVRSCYSHIFKTGILTSQEQAVQMT